VPFILSFLKKIFKNNTFYILTIPLKTKILRRGLKELENQLIIRSKADLIHYSLFYEEKEDGKSACRFGRHYI
jgi:hypothetical protein